MAIVINATLRGDKDFDRIFYQMGKRFGPKNAEITLRTAVRRTVAPLRSPIRSGTPYRTGALRRSVKLRSGAWTRRGRKVGIRAVVGWFNRYEAPKISTGLRQRLARRGRKPQARIIAKTLGQEFGNVHTRSVRVLRRVFAQHQPRMLARFTDELRSQIIRVANQLSRGQREVK